MVEIKRKTTIPNGHGVRVHKAIQGHPEAPRLWATLINKIIKGLGFNPCKHEPCLYHNPNYKGHNVYFLRQVDDFAISTKDEAIANDIIQEIDSHMTIKVKPLGIIERFNGVDISQTKQYIKLSNRTYIEKILEGKNINDNTSHLNPIPMNENPTYIKDIETTTPLDADGLKNIEKEYGYSYRQAIGELLYLMITCRPDISFPLIKLSQYNTHPAKIHFEAVRNIYRYVKATANDGIYYWRSSTRKDRPTGPLPKCADNNNYTPQTREQLTGNDIRAAVDSDFGNDTTHRKSVTGINIKIAGGSVHYKTRFQSTTALSSTEAEFTAACDAAKSILYVRSILSDLGIAQEHATTLYEDNQGALLMANSGQPTKRTRHMDIKYFALQDWVDQDLITLKRIDTSDNEADTLTKCVGRTLFYRHNDFIMGRVIPDYVNMDPLDQLDTLKPEDV